MPQSDTDYKMLLLFVHIKDLYGFCALHQLEQWLVLMESNTTEDVKHPFVSPTIFSSEPRISFIWELLQRLKKLTSI